MITLTPQQAEILVKIQARLDFFRRLHGERWPTIVAEYDRYLQVRMAQDKSDILAAAISLAKQLAEAGHDPNELLAAAAEIIGREGKTPQPEPTHNPPRP